MAVPDVGVRAAVGAALGRVPAVRAVLIALAVGLSSFGLAVGGIWFGLHLSTAGTYPSALGSASFHVELSSRGTVEVFIPLPDWGLRAHAFSAPLTLHVEPRVLNRQALIAAGSGDPALLQRTLKDPLARKLWAEGYSSPLTILTGHDHIQHVNHAGPVNVVDAGSIGAGGLYGVGSDFVGLGQLHFVPGRPELDAADLIQVEPVSGVAQAQRIADSLATLGRISHELWSSPSSARSCTSTAARGPTTWTRARARTPRRSKDCTR